MDDDAEVYGKHAEALVRFATVLDGPDDAADLVQSAAAPTLLCAVALTP
jgi:hypothetical protein